MLTEHAEGFPLASQVTFGDKKISKGTKLRETHINRLLEAGVEEVMVKRGAAPDMLDYFRVLRKSRYHEGYVEDPELYDKYDLEPGKSLTEIPIMVTSETVDQVLQTRLVNYDREENCVFCSSEDGQTAVRRKTTGEKDGEGDYLRSGAKKEVECIPFYNDERVEKEGKKICPFRSHDNGGRECQFTGRFFFNILNEEGSFSLGRHFMLETTSESVIENYLNALVGPDNDSVKSTFGQISFVPMKLEVVRVETTRPSGKYEDGDRRRKTSVSRTALSVSDEYLEKYQEPVEEILDTIETYQRMSVPGKDPTPDPTQIPEQDVMTGPEKERWDAEFSQEASQEILEDEGLDGVEPDEEAAEAGSVLADGSDNDSEEGEETSVTEYELHCQELVNRARQLPPDRYQKFLDNREKISPDTIGRFSEHLDKVLAGLSEDEKAEHYDQNVEAEEEMDDAPTVAPLP
jgi:Asp-tRNA(Asn)/Glu-tRNA(Gln) amidotransferase C subunit